MGNLMKTGSNDININFSPIHMEQLNIKKLQ